MATSSVRYLNDHVEKLSGQANSSFFFFILISLLRFDASGGLGKFLSHEGSRWGRQTKQPSMHLKICLKRLEVPLLKTDTRREAHCRFLALLLPLRDLLLLLSFSPSLLRKWLATLGLVRLLFLLSHSILGLCPQVLLSIKVTSAIPKRGECVSSRANHLFPQEQPGARAGFPSQAAAEERRIERVCREAAGTSAAAPAGGEGGRPGAGRLGPSQAAPGPAPPGPQHQLGVTFPARRLR